MEITDRLTGSRNTFSVAKLVAADISQPEE
jgi:hypothetical protein